MNVAVDDEYFASIKKKGLIWYSLISFKPEAQFEIKHNIKRTSGVSLIVHVNIHHQSSPLTLKRLSCPLVIVRIGTNVNN